MTSDTDNVGITTTSADKIATIGTAEDGTYTGTGATTGSTIKSAISTLNSDVDTAGSVLNSIKANAKDAIYQAGTGGAADVTIAEAIASKQDALTAGSGIAITDNVVSASGIADANVAENAAIASSKIAFTDAQNTVFASGITADDVTQIGTNQTNIAKVLSGDALNNVLTTANGKATIWNETSGGGVMFEDTSHNKAYTGVNGGNEGGLFANMYVKSSDGSARLMVKNDGAYILTSDTDNVGITTTSADKIATIGSAEDGTYTGTGAATGSTIKSAIGANYTAIDNITNGTTYTDEMEANVAGTIEDATGDGLTYTSGQFAVNRASAFNPASQTIEEWVGDNTTNFADVQTTTAVLTTKLNTVQQDLMASSNNASSIARALVGAPATAADALTLPQAVASVAINQAYDDTAGAYVAGSVGEKIQANETAINTLNGSSSTAGSVQNSIKSRVQLATGETYDSAGEGSTKVYSVAATDAAIAAASGDVQAVLGNHTAYSGGPLAGKTFNKGVVSTDVTVANAFELLNTGVDTNTTNIAKVLSGDALNNVLTTANGKATIWNETSGGGVMFEDTSHNKAYTGVNGGNEGGLFANMYVKSSDGSARLMVKNDGAYILTSDTNNVGITTTSADKIATIGTAENGTYTGTGEAGTISAAIKGNADAIAKRTVTANADGTATVSDGTTNASFYTKGAAEAIFTAKQQWVDNTLGIVSANPDAVKEQYANTTYLQDATTLTGADIALDAAITQGETDLANVLNGTTPFTGFKMADAQSTGAETQYIVADNITKAMINKQNQGETTLATAASVYKAIGHVDGLVTLESGVKTFNGTADEGLTSTNVTEGGTYVGNLAVGTDVARDLVELDNAVGNLNFTDAAGDGNIDTNYLNGNTSVGESLVDLDTQVANRTVTNNGDGTATVSDGTTNASFYTKTAAEAIFNEKQTWVDNTLGIVSEHADAVKEQYATTNYLQDAETLTGADKVLDSQIAKRTVTDNADGTATVSDGTTNASFYTKTAAEAIFNEKQTWVDNTLGIVSEHADAVKEQYATTNYLQDAETLTGADKVLDSQIAKRTVTDNADGTATVSDGTTNASFYTKTAAEAIFNEKQTWVDNTLGIVSEHADAVKEQYATTNYLQDAETLTGADKVLDSQIAKRTVTDNADGTATVSDGTTNASFYTKTAAEAIFNEKQTWVDNTLGIVSEHADAVKEQYATTNYLQDAETLTGADKVLDSQIAKRTVTDNADGTATVSDGTTNASFYTKTAAEAIFNEKQTWVDNTLGIVSEHADAVKEQYATTNYLQDAETLTGADKVLDGQIKATSEDASYAKKAVQGVASKVGGGLGDDGTYTAESYSSVNNYNSTDTVIRAIGGVDMAVGDISGLTGFTATNLVGAANELMLIKQDKLTLNYGLQWDDNDETEMSVKLADGSGLTFDSTTKGLKIKVGDSMSVSNEGYLNIKYGSEFTTDGNGLKLENKAVTGAKIADYTITFDKLATTGVYTQTISGGGSEQLLATTKAVADYVEDEAENGDFTGDRVNGVQGAIKIKGAISETNAQVDKNTARFTDFASETQTVAEYVTANAVYGTYDPTENYEAGTIGAALNNSGVAMVAGDGIVLVDGNKITVKKGTGLEFVDNDSDPNTPAQLAVKTAAAVASGNDGYVTSDLLAAQGYQNEDQVNDLIEDVTGDLDTLTTDQKGTLVAAINEVDGHADDAQAAADEANNTIGAGAITAGTAGSLTTKVIGDNATGGEITVRDAIETLNATNVQENASMNTIAGLVNGATVDAATGAYSATGADSLAAGFSAGNLTAAANELLGKITVPENDPGESYNFIQAGSNVANNLILLDQNIGSHDGKIDSLAGVISGHFNGDDFVKDDYGSTNNITDADSLTTAIGKLDAAMGDVDDLNTTATDVVGAINEVKDTADAAAETAGKANNTATGVAQKLGGTVDADTGEYTAASYGDTLYNITNSDTVIDAVGKLDGAMGKLTADGDYIKENKNFAQNLVILDGQVSQNTQDIDNIESLIGSTPKTGHGILNDKTITGATGEGNLTIVDAIDYVAQNAAGLKIDNVFEGKNTFGTTEGSQVIITNGGSMTVDHNLTVGDSLTIGEANAISSTEDGKLDMGGNALENVNGLTLTNGTDHTHDATISVGDNGIEMSKSVNIDGSITATGIDTSEDNKVKLGGTGYTTEVTGDLTVSGKSTLNELEVTGDTLLADTTVGGDLTVTGTSTFGSAATGGSVVINGADHIIDVKDGNSNTVAYINKDGTASFKDTTVDGKLTADELSVADDKFVVGTDGTVTLSDGGAGDDENTATMGMTQIEVQNGTGAETIKNVVKVDGNGLFTGDVASEKGFVVATQSDPANPYVIQYQVNDKGEINAAYDEDHNRFNFTVAESGATTMQDTLTVASGGADITGNTTVKGTFGAGANATEFVVGTDGAVHALGLETNAENGVDLGLEGKQTDIIGSTINVTASDSANVSGTNSASVKAGTNGIDVTAAAGENPGGTNVTGNFSVGENKFTVAGDTGNTAIAGTLDVTGLSSLDGGINVNDKFTVNTEGDTQAETLAFNGDQQPGEPAVLVNSIDQGAEAITDGEVSDTRKETMATVATVAKTIGNLASKKNLNANGITNVDDVAEAIGSLAKNVKDATGGEFADDGEWTGRVTGGKEVNYAANVDYHDLISAVDQVSSNIGRETTVANNGAQADATVNENIDAINTRIGDVDTMENTYKNLSNGAEEAPATVVDALQNVDRSMGTIHGLSDKLGNKYQGNLAEGNDATVEAHLTSIDRAIGNRARFAETHYATDSKDVVDAITKVDNGLYHLDQDVRDLRHHFEAGMASAAALSALVPNARAHGDTQLSLGTGAYRGHGAIAVGGFHWFTDNLLMNAGVAWDNNEATYRMGVTYSF